MWAIRCGRSKDLEGTRSLLRDDPITQSGELSRAAQACGVGHPAGVQALHPLHEQRAETARAIRGSWRRAGEALPSGDSSGVWAPLSTPPSGVGDSASNSGSGAICRGVRRADRWCVDVPVLFTSEVGRSRAAAEGKVKSPLQWRWFGEPLVPSEALGVGRSHSTSSAKFGPWPPSLRFAGC